MNRCMSLLVLALLAGAAQASAAGWLGVRMAPRGLLERAVEHGVQSELLERIPRPELVLEQWGDEPGVLVSEVLVDTPAERAGLLAGDVVVELNHIRVDSASTLAFLMRRAIPGRPGTIVVLRDGERRELLFTVGEREQDQEQKQSDD